MRVVVFDVLGKVDIAREIRAFVPAVEKTVDNESGFANSSGTVEDERLRDAVMLHVIVQYGL